MKQTISFKQEVEVLNQVKVSTHVISVVTVSNTDGSIDCACNLLSDVMHKDSEALNDRVFGNINATLVKYDTKWTSKTLEYRVCRSETPEITQLELIRIKYKYE